MPDPTASRPRIERVKPSIFDAVLPLIADYQRFYGQEPDVNENRRFFGELLEDNPHGLQLAAQVGPDVVGFATLYWVRSSTRATTMALLNDLYVHPDHRGGRTAGVGTALMDAAARAAADRGFVELTWETAPDNRTAQALYDRFVSRSPDPRAPSTWLHYSCPLSTKGEQ